MPRCLGSVLGLALTLLVCSPRAWSHEVVHGAHSLFVAPTVKIAWTIRKGAREEDTLVVLRIVNRTGSYQQVRLDGVDPFSKARRVLVALRPLADKIDLTLPRSSFADFPSCEIHLFAKDAAVAAPSLTVYYLGVPDTTPEFKTAQDAEAYLAKTLGQ